MSSLTLPSTWRHQFEPQRSWQIRHEDGSLLGRYVPEEEYQKLVYAALAKECPYTADELAKMHAEKGGKQLDDILRQLEQQ